MLERQPDFEAEDRLVAALGHLGAFAPFFGALAALVIWLTQKGRSSLLAFQALQALLFQALALVVYYVVYLGLNVMSLIYLLPLMALSDSSGGDGAWIGLLFFSLVLFSVLLLMALAALAYYLLAALAAVNLLRGRDYRYPLIGKLTENLTHRR